MKKLLSILALLAPLAAIGCQEARVYTIGDADRWWTNESRGLNDGYTVENWARAVGTDSALREVRDQYSVGNASSHFEQRSAPVARKVSLAAANDAINHDEDYRDLVNEYSLATAEDRWTQLLRERYKRKPNRR